MAVTLSQELPRILPYFRSTGELSGACIDLYTRATNNG